MLYRTPVDSSKEILINKMYVGEYLLNNIGHEVINLLRADGNVDKNGDGQNYIYINHLGTMEKEHNDKIDTVLLVRNTGLPNTLEVLAQAWDLEQIAKVKKSTHNREIKEICQIQDEYIKNNNVTYCKKPINEIFSKNIDNDNAVSITFKANKLRRPKKIIYITFNHSNDEMLPYIDEKKVHLVYLNKQNQIENRYSEAIQTLDMAKASLKMYIKNGSVVKNPNVSYPNRKEQNQEYAFAQLKTLLEDENLWQEANTTIGTINIKENEYDKYNFMDLVDKQFAEVTYSNLFQHVFLSNGELFQKFAEEVLEINNVSADIDVVREESHIDLLVTDKNNVIVIENKIKSGINGIKYDIHGEEIGSQLYDYYNYVNGLKQKSNDVWVQDSELINKFGNKDKHFFIFAPDYNSIDTSKIQYVPQGTYTSIPYSKIYSFYNKYQKDYANKIPYYNEFLYAIGKHINNVDNSLEIEMHKKFAKVIESK